MQPRRWALVGAGAAGTAVMALLVRKGHRLEALWSRRRARAKAARFLIGQGEVVRSPAEASALADSLLIAVPDGALGGVAVDLLKRGALRAGQTLIHLSGAQPASVLKVRPGLRLGAMHPIQTLPTAAEGIRSLPGSWFGIEGSPGMLPELSGLVGDVGGIPVKVPAEGKALYHAAMAMASNHLTGLAAASAEMLALTGFRRGAALKALLPLMRGTLGALELKGLPQALTGPVARGDLETVRAHLGALRRQAPGLTSLYVACALQVLQVARNKGLEGGRARAIEKALWIARRR